MRVTGYLIRTNKLLAIVMMVVVVGDGNMVRKID